VKVVYQERYGDKAFSRGLGHCDGARFHAGITFDERAIKSGFTEGVTRRGSVFFNQALE
jgi:hypothetical protein